jgi:15-cis-phytoene synthase
MPDRPDAPAARALAWLYSPPALREPLATLLALEHEIGESLRPGRDHQLAHARLAWWREECVRSTQGRASHPLTRELGALFAASGLAPPAGLAGLVDTAVWDLAAATFATRRELEGYCGRWSAAMIEPLVQLAAPAAAPEPARALGRSLHEIELLLSLASDARHGRLRLPLDELEGAPATAEELARPPWPEALAGLVRARHRQARAALEASVAALAPSAQPPLRGLLVWAAVARAHSLRAERRLPRASLSREHHAPLDGWCAWRAARRADAGRGFDRSG